jgi:hypothetical protein
LKIDIHRFDLLLSFERFLNAGRAEPAHHSIDRGLDRIGDGCGAKTEADDLN